MKTDTPPPETVYQNRHDRTVKELNRLESHSSRISLYRLLLFFAIVTVALTAILSNPIPLYWSLAPLLAFAALLIYHDRIIQRIQKLKWIRDYYRDGLLRLQEQWIGQGNTRSDYVSSDHLYATDLDLFGEGSLFELICTARTRSGEEQIAHWLTRTSNAAEILDRQQAIQELLPMVDLREDIHVCTLQMRSLVHPARLQQWAMNPAGLSAKRIRMWQTIFLLLGITATAAIVSCFVSDFGLAFLTLTAIIEWIIGRRCRPFVEAIIHAVEGPKKQLTILSAILERFEKQEVHCPLLLDLRESLLQNGPASRQVFSLSRLVDGLHQASNQLFAPLAFLLMWRGHFALRIEKWRIAQGQHVSGWLASAGHLEALCSLSGYAFEHPDDIFPAIQNNADPVIRGTEVGHPLLPRSSRVRNDINIGGDTRLQIVSGSNMSGKSTWLRTIGINAVLAMTGAPVCARSFSISPMAIGSTIRIQDSLQKGTSRFYAEIQTLKQIVDLSRGDKPILFLLDEIFHGTNSHDRRIGAEAILCELVRCSAIGLVTTHDLALTKIVEQMNGQGQNVHFDDTVVNGSLHFDYRLKDGPVRKSNAVELMRSVGLNV